MYVFKIKLYDVYSNSSRSYSFPTKSPKKRGTSGIAKYTGSSDLGWFKCKKIEDAEKGFIHLLKYTISDLQSPLIKSNPRTRNRPYGSYASCKLEGNPDEKAEAIKFLVELMQETEIRFMDKYPEVFI